MGTTLFIGLVTGALGMAYLVYGKRRGRLAPLVAGLGLCIVPYLIGGIWLVLAGVVLAAAPFFIDS